MNTTVPPPEDIPKWADQTKARKEVANWADEDALRGQKNKNDLNWLRVYRWVVILVFLFFMALFIGSVAVWALHYLLPEEYHWLQPAQLSKVQSVLFSGSIGSIVSLAAQKQLSKTGN